MSKFINRKTIIIFLIAVLVSLVLSILSAVSGGRISPLGSLFNMIAKPVQGAATSVGNFFTDMTERNFQYDALKAENEKLREELELAKAAARENDALGKENVQLRAALGMRERDSSFVFEPAEIVAKNSDNWSSTFTLNKGSNVGIALDNCVVTAEGMVGFVSEVGPTWATVTSITDMTMEASAIASRTRDVASVEGDFELMKKGQVRLSYLPRDTQVLEGDVIETSGVGGLFPKGIVIGTVLEVRNESHGISKYAIIEPSVDLDSANHVLVIKSFTFTE